MSEKVSIDMVNAFWDTMKHPFWKSSTRKRISCGKVSFMCPNCRSCWIDDVSEDTSLSGNQKLPVGKRIELLDYWCPNAFCQDLDFFVILDENQNPIRVECKKDPNEVLDDAYCVEHGLSHMCQ